MLKKKLFYIADFSLPNRSAYALHVLKMCDAFSEFTNKNVELLIPYREKTYNYKNIKNEFLLKKKFKITDFFPKKNKLNFLKRMIFSLKVYHFLKKEKNNFVVVSRSISSIILALFNIKSILEIHTELTGLTKNVFF